MTSCPTPCFVCGDPATTTRSLSKITAAPATENDTIHVCQDCNDDWTASLAVILSLDLRTKKKKP
jgi:hypothetical protein